MRVLHLLSSNKYSGAENVVCQIINMFRFDTDMEFVYCSPDGPIRQALENQGISFAPLSKLSVSVFKKIIREVKPDIIHAHDMKASVIAAAVAGDIPLISHIHNNNFNSQKPSVKAVLYRCAATKAKHIFWVSQSSMTGYCFHKRLEKKSTVLYNVIDINQLRQKAMQAECQTPYDIVYIGRLTYQKNPQRLLTVLEEIVRKQPTVKAAIIGGGDLEGEVQGILAENKLQNNVHYLGFMSNPYGILQNAKVMLMTSRWEGLPMCALEAMALGVPIVSTPTDGMQELLEAGEGGYLADDDEALVDGLIRFLRDSQYRATQAAGALKKAERDNNIGVYAKELEAAYREATDND